MRVESEDTKTFNGHNHGPCVEDRNAVSRVDPNASIDKILSIFFIQLVNYKYKSKYRAKKSPETIGFSCCEEVPRMREFLSESNSRTLGQVPNPKVQCLQLYHKFKDWCK